MSGSHQSSSATSFDNRTNSNAELAKETSTNAENFEALDSFGNTPFAPVLVQSKSKSSGINRHSDLSHFDPHAPLKTPPTVTKQSWVQFDEDYNDDRMSTSSRGTSMSSSSIKYHGMQPASQFSPSMSATRSGINSPSGSRFVKDWVKYGAHSPLFGPNTQTAGQNPSKCIFFLFRDCGLTPTPTPKKINTQAAV